MPHRRSDERLALRTFGGRDNCRKRGGPRGLGQFPPDAETLYGLPRPASGLGRSKRDHAGPLIAVSALFADGLSDDIYKKSQASGPLPAAPRKDREKSNASSEFSAIVMIQPDVARIKR